MFWQLPERLVWEVSTCEISTGDITVFIKETMHTAYSSSWIIILIFWFSPFPLSQVHTFNFIYLRWAHFTAIWVSSLGHCFLPCAFILNNSIEFNESILNEERCPECVTASLGFCLTGLKSQVVHEKKNRQHLFCVQICLYSFVSCSGDRTL